MAEMEKMEGASMNPLANMPAEARENLMKASDSIAVVLMARLNNMKPEELVQLDRAITPEVAAVLMKLLPELNTLIGEQAAKQAKEVKQQQPTMRRDMGALGNM